MSTLSSLRRYSTERVTFPTFDVLAVALVVISRIDLGVAMRWPALLDIALAFVVLLQLRLWNDLDRLEEDRQTHPKRVLALSPNLAPYQLAVTSLFVVVFLWLTVRAVSSCGLRLAPILYTGLLLFLASCYASRGRRHTSPVLHYHAVSLKYPVLVCLVSPSAGVPWRAMVFTYLSVCIFVVLRDRQLKRLTDARVAAGFEIATLIAGGLILAMEHRS